MVAGTITESLSNFWIVNGRRLVEYTKFDQLLHNLYQLIERTMMYQAEKPWRTMI